MTDFLVLYWILVGLAVLLGAAGPALLPAPRPRRHPRDEDLGPYELAMLAGGPRRVVDTALAGLIATGAARRTETGTIVPAASRPQDRLQRQVLTRICHNRRLTSGPDDLGVCHRSPGRGLTRRLLALGYLTRRRAGAHLHLLLVGVMAVGVAHVVAGHGAEFLANTAVVTVVLLVMLSMMYGANALEAWQPTGLAMQSRRQLRAVTGMILMACAGSVVALAPPGTGGTMTSVVATAALWWGLRAFLRRTTAPVTTHRGREVVANIATREPSDELLTTATAPHHVPR